MGNFWTFLHKFNIHDWSNLIGKWDEKMSRRCMQCGKKETYCHQTYTYISTEERKKRCSGCDKRTYFCNKDFRHRLRKEWQ